MLLAGKNLGGAPLIFSNDFGMFTLLKVTWPLCCDRLSCWTPVRELLRNIYAAVPLNLVSAIWSVLLLKSLF